MQTCKFQRKHSVNLKYTKHTKLIVQNIKISSFYRSYGNERSKKDLVMLNTTFKYGVIGSSAAKLLLKNIPVLYIVSYKQLSQASRLVRDSNGLL